MNREIFKIKNNTISDIELKSFGLIISSGQTIELGNFDNAVLSNELYNYIQNGSLVRIINNLPVDSGSSYYQSSESYTSVLNNMIYVSKTGGTFTKIQDAIDSINDATYENRYVISVNVGTYTENIIMKNYVSLKGESNETKIVGNVTFNSLLIGNSEIYNIIIQSTNTPTIYINTISVGYRVYLHDVGLISIWDDDSSIKSVVDIQSGSLNIMSRSILSLTSYDTGSTNNDLSVIYYVHGTSKIELISSYSTNYIYEYNNINVCSLYFNNNINIDFNTSFIKDGSFTMTLCGSLPSNMIKIFNHSGTTSITVADNFYMKLLSNNDISNVIYLPAYNNYSIPHDVSGTTLGSEICLSFCTMTWDQVKIPDNVVYLGVAISEIDYVELMSFIYDTNFDVIPSEYLIDGVSSGLTIDITNSWGSYLNTSSIKTYNIQIGDSGNYVTDIFDDSGLTSNSHYALPTQYSVKSYIDNALLGINTGTTLTKTEFYTYTGTTLPTNYYNKSEIGVISGQTYNVISLKSDLISPNFSGTPTSTVAAQDTNTIQIATTSYVVGQASSVNPLMNGTVAIGTSLRYARADHVHPNDTTKLNISDYNIFTGTTLPSNYYNKTQSDLLLNGKSNTGHTHSTIDITNLSIYSGFTNYYIKSETDAQLIKGKIVDDTNINDNRSLVYDSISGKIVYKSVLDTSPTIQARRTSDYTVTTSWTNVLFTQTDVENKPDTLYWDSVNTDRFYVTESGYYSLMFQSKVTCTTTTTQTNVQMLINNTTVIVGSDTYVNVYSGEVHPLISSVVTYLTGGSYIVIQVMRNQTSSTLLANPRFIMYKMDGVVGARGATGSGSNITVQNNGTGVQNTPHSILNFTGNIVSVNDSGSGVATISINQSVYGTEFHYIQDLTTTTTTSVTPTYATKITLTTSTLSGGTYKITATYGVNKNNITTDLLSRVTVDGTMIGNVHNHELSDTATYLYTTRVFFVTLTATTHTILLQFSNETSGTVSARDASLELIRVS